MEFCYPNQFYALPQSPQTLKQLLMVAGYDKYFQIVRCFRDEDLRADRQPEFTQIDCEMSFVEQEDVLEIFERWAKHMFREVMGIELTEPLRRMPWIEAMEKYGSDKPDLRFGMEFADLTDLAQGHGFAVFDDAEYVTGFAATGCAGYTRKQIDALTEFVKRQQIGAKGLVWIRVEADGNVKSSVDKFYSPEQVRAMAERAGANLSQALTQCQTHQGIAAVDNQLGQNHQPQAGIFHNGGKPRKLPGTGQIAGGNDGGLRHAQPLGNRHCTKAEADGKIPQSHRQPSAHAQGVLLIFHLSLTSLSMELNLVIIRLPHISVKGTFPFL